MNGKLPDEAIRKALRHQVRSGALDCPDENAVAAYLEGALTDQEKGRVEEHAASCTDCQELLALCLKAAEAESHSAPQAEGALPSPKTVYFRLSIPLAGLAAAIFFLVAGVVIFRIVHQARQAGVVIPIADARRSQPEQKEAEPAAAADRPSAGPSTSLPQSQPAESSQVRAITGTARGGVQSPSEPAGKPPRDKDAVQGATTLRAESQAAAPADKVVMLVSGETSAPAKRELPEAEAAAKGREIAGGVAVNATARVEKRPEPVAERRRSDIPIVEEVNPQRTAPAQVTAADMKELAVAPQTGAREAVRRFAGELSQSGTLPGPSRRVLDRTFYDRGAYWVDAACAATPNMEITEIEPGSAEYDEVLSAYPGIREMLVPGKAVLLRRDNKILLIR